MLLKGKKIAGKIKIGLKTAIKKAKINPELAVILVGKNSASLIYVKLKEKLAREVGIGFKKFILPSKTSQKNIINLIKKLNKKKSINGIIVQLPLPTHLNTNKIIGAIDVKKDVDGFVKNSIFVSPTHQAILKLLSSTKQNLKNKKALIIANSLDFASPLANILKRKKIIPEILIKPKKNEIKKTDIVIIAIGKPKYLKQSMVKKNSIIIDAGYNYIKGKSIGDVDIKVGKKIKFLSPVPGGVGPLTVIYLLKNVYLSKTLQISKK